MKFFNQTKNVTAILSLTDYKTYWLMNDLLILKFSYLYIKSFTFAGFGNVANFVQFKIYCKFFIKSFEFHDLIILCYYSVIFETDLVFK